MTRALRALAAAFTFAAFGVASPSRVEAQSGTARDHSGIGVYFGLIYEGTKFDGGSARALEDESGRIGVFVGRWSAGYVGKNLRAVSPMVVWEGDIASSLHIQAVEVGYLVTNRWRVQPVVFVSVGRGEVVAYERVFGPPYPPSASAASRVIEPSIGVGISLGPIFRLDGRAGMRFGSDVTVGADEYSLTGAVASATVSFGWMGPWRARRGPR